MDKITKLCVLFFALNIFEPVHTQLNVRFDNNCLLANSTELGRALIETIGEKKTRLLIERNVNIRIIVEVDSTGRVRTIKRCNMKFISPKDSIRLLTNIKSKRQFYLCYVDALSQKDVIIKELRSEFLRNQKRNIVLLFPGQFHEEYIHYKGKSKKVDYIIEYLERNK